jgi:hypothetical protein
MYFETMFQQAPFNSISLDDSKLIRKLEQTELNISAILDGTIRGFTNDDINSVKKINERFKYRKEQFSDFKEDRAAKGVRSKR